MFQMQKNFNPIDITMISKKIDFVQTVNYLKAYQKRIHKKPDTRTQNLSVPLSIKEILMDNSYKINNLFNVINFQYEYICYKIQYSKDYV